MKPYGTKLKPLLFLFFPSFMIFSTCELSLRLFASGHLSFYRSIVGDTPLHAAIFRNPGNMKKFQVPVNPHAADPVLGWKNQIHFKQNPYLTTSHGILSPHEIPYERNKAAYRLLVLGDSSSAGLGIEKQSDTWPQVLQRSLPDSIEVINASVIGYSSEQALAALFREFYKYQPDGIVIYLGSNDGFGSSMTDRRLLDYLHASKPYLVSLENWFVDHWATYVFLKAAAKYFNQIAFGTDVGVEVLNTPRVPLVQFRENISAMIRWAERAGSDVYVITPPTPLEYPPRILEYNYRRAYEPGWANRNGCLDQGKASNELLPAILNTEVTSSRYPKYDFPIARYTTQVLRCFEGRLVDQRERFSRLVETGSKDAVVYNNLGYVYAQSGDKDSALSAFLNAIHLAPNVGAFHYNAGLLCRRLGDEDKAVAHLQTSIDLDWASPRIHSTYFAELERIAGMERLVVLINANRIFRKCNNESLFADHVHPNEKGQELVARLVARAVWSRRLGAFVRGRGCDTPNFSTNLRKLGPGHLRSRRQVLKNGGSHDDADS
jgi:lysophospholipase L1-like esterase